MLRTGARHLLESHGVRLCAKSHGNAKLKNAVEVYVVDTNDSILVLERARIYDFETNFSFIFPGAKEEESGSSSS